MSTPASPRQTVQPPRDQLDDLEALLQRMLELPVNQLDASEAEGRQSSVIVTAPPPSAAQAPAADERSTGKSQSRAPGRKRPPILPRPALPPAPLQPMVKQTRVPLTEPASEVPQPPVSLTVVEQAPAATSPKVLVQEPVSQPIEAPKSPGTGPTIKIVPPGTVAPPPNQVEHKPAVPAPLRLPETGSPEKEQATRMQFSNRRLTQGDEYGLEWWRWPLGWLNLGFDYLADRTGAPGRWLRQAQGRWVIGLVGVALLGIAALVLILDWIGWTP